MGENNLEKKVVIPYGSLSTEALDGIIENFILREGTDYGVTEHTYEQKKSKVIKQLESGHIAVVFDSVSDSCNLIKSEEL